MAARPSAPPRTGAWRFPAAALGLLVVALTLAPIGNNDLFLHLVTGQVVLERHEVPRTDDYSALARGRPYVAHEWLAAVLFRLVQRAGSGEGFDRLVLAKVALSLALAWLLLRAARHAGASRPVALAGLAWVLCLAAARLQERPHLFAYLLLAAFVLVLARRRRRLAAGRSDRGLFLLPLLQVLWANLHGSFLLGPAIVLLAAAGSAFERLLPGRSSAARDEGATRAETLRLAALALVLVPLCLVNPYGVDLLRFPFALTGSRFMKQIYEWLPPYDEAFRGTYMARLYVIWAAVSAAVWIASLARPRRLPRGAPFHLLLFASFLALSLRMNRSVTDFALATLPGTTAMWSALLARRALARAPRPAFGRAAPLVLGGVLLAAAAWFAHFGYPYSPATVRRPGIGLAAAIPVRAVDYLAREHLDGACFNTYSAGAYLVYRLWPALRVGMDSRNDVYGEELYAEYERALGDPAALAAMLSRIGASFIFLEWAEQGMAAAGRTVRGLDPPWPPVYFDDRAVIYAPVQGPRADLVRRDGYRVLDPVLFRPGTWGEDEAERALGETGRAAAAGGDPAIVAVMRIEALRTLGRREEANREEARLLRSDPPLYHIFILLGLSHLAHGEAGDGIARLERALQLNPKSSVAATALREAQPGAGR